MFTNFSLLSMKRPQNRKNWTSRQQAGTCGGGDGVLSVVDSVVFNTRNA
jgi:hypothetical protein